MLGAGQPVVLHLLDIEPAKNALEGVRMELIDASYPLLKGEPSDTFLGLCCCFASSCAYGVSNSAAHRQHMEVWGMRDSMLPYGYEHTCT